MFVGELATPKERRRRRRRRRPKKKKKKNQSNLSARFSLYNSVHFDATFNAGDSPAPRAATASGGAAERAVRSPVSSPETAFVFIVVGRSRNASLLLCKGATETEEAAATATRARERPEAPLAGATPRRDERTDERMMVWGKKEEEKEKRQRGKKKSKCKKITCSTCCLRSRFASNSLPELFALFVVLFSFVSLPLCFKQKWLPGTRRCVRALSMPLARGEGTRAMRGESKERSLFLSRPPPPFLD